MKRNDEIHVLEAKHYEEARVALADDPIIQAMYLGLPVELRQALADGTIEDRSGLMTAALREYHARDGKVGTHIGGPLEALELIARKDRS